MHGMGGIGKTALVTRLAEQVKEEFDYLIWRSLRNAPPLSELLADWLLFLSDQQTIHPPAELDKGSCSISQLPVKLIAKIIGLECYF